MDDWDLEAPQPKKDAPSGGTTPGGPTAPAGAERAARVDPAAVPAPQASQGPSAEPPRVPQTPSTAAPQAAKRRSKAGRIIPLVLGGLALLLVGALAGFFIARSQSAVTSDQLAEAKRELAVVQKGLAESEERNWNYYREDQALQAQIEVLQGGSGTSVPTTVPASPGTYTDGIYSVGEDISPGDYDGVVIGEVGYWARLRGTDGNIGAIVANGLETGPFVLTINTSDVAVELRGVKLTSR